jgi:hypothetical protein
MQGRARSTIRHAHPGAREIFTSDGCEEAGCLTCTLARPLVWRICRRRSCHTGRTHLRRRARMFSRGVRRTGTPGCGRWAAPTLPSSSSSSSSSNSSRGGWGSRWGLRLLRTTACCLYRAAITVEKERCATFVEILRVVRSVLHSWNVSRLCIQYAWNVSRLCI